VVTIIKTAKKVQVVHMHSTSDIGWAITTSPTWPRLLAPELSADGFTLRFPERIVSLGTFFLIDVLKCVLLI
jgi:hypothetical protein